VSSGKHFPDRIDDLLNTADPVWIRNVEGELVKAGARVGPDGQLYDNEKKGMYLWIWPPGGGCWRSEADLQQERERLQRALRDAKQRYRVIEVTWKGHGPSPP
jgi:proteasome lid subunit RPN8/RPN11